MKTTTVLLLILACVASCYGQDSQFVTVKLPLGVSVDVPRNWWVISGDWNATIKTSAEAVLDLSGVERSPNKLQNLFRANSRPTQTYASIAINVRDVDVTPEALQATSAGDVHAIGDYMMEELRKGAQVQGWSILDYYGARRDSINGRPALVIDYRRSSPQDSSPQSPVVVQLNRIILPKRMISLNLSYRESEATIWKPVIERIRRSFWIR